MKVVERQISKVIYELIQDYPVVALTGPRQSGKTTLLKNLFPEYQYVSLEMVDLRNFATEDPIGFLNTYSSHVIFDEAQRVPHLFSYIQAYVDKSGEMGQFILSGSQNFHLMEKITQSLAGRVAILKLMPFDLSELEHSGMQKKDIQSQIIKGFYPAIYDRNMNPSRYYSNYIQTYIDRDISDLTNIHDKKRFSNFISLCAGRTGQILNLNNLANACGITQPTARSWLSILENSYIIFHLPPYFENFNKRIIKSSKLYFYDTGLASFLLGLRQKNDLDNSKLMGPLFENMVISEFFKRNHHLYQLKEFWFWRDSNDHEVDLLTKHSKGFDIFEIKSAKTILSGQLKAFNFFDKASGGQVHSKTLIYGGNEDQNRTNLRARSWMNPAKYMLIY